MTHLTQLNTLEPLTHEVEGSSVVYMHTTRTERIAITATLALVAALGTTAAVTNSSSPTATHEEAPTAFDPATIPDSQAVVIQWVDDLSCGTIGTEALGCYRWDGSKNIYLDSSLSDHAILSTWVIAHETAHAYGATECEADDYAYSQTHNEVIYHNASIYAKQCGNYLSPAELVEM